MRKNLLSWAFVGMLMSGFSMAADAAEIVNLTPNFEFNKAETPLLCIASTPTQWNLPVNWVNEKIINGDLDATGGALVLSGGAPMVNFPNEYKALNEHIRLINLGGTCGQVWAVNYNGSKFQDVLASEYDIAVDVPNHTHASGWYQRFQYLFIPDPAVMMQYGGKKLRCRMEVNFYKNTEANDEAFYGYLVTDQGANDEADYTVASANRIKYADFYTDGKWDATKWLVYEFEFTVPNATENLSDWTSAPFFKYETDNNNNSAIMIRNITVYDPEGVEGLEPIDRTKKNFANYTVGAVETEPQVITELWKTEQVEAFVGKWTGTAPDWATPDAIKATSNTRFATAYNGKIYTVDQKTMSIAEVTKEGELVPVYVLPKPADEADFYGTAIAVDEVGNFLIGMNFVQRPTSSTKFAIYSPAENACKEFNLEVPEGWTVGRLDCMGRVLGDLTKDAVFTIAPETGAYTSAVRVIGVKGEGTLESITVTDLGNAPVAGNYTQQNIAQPAYRTMAEAKAANGTMDFYYSSCTGTNNYYASYIDGTVTSNFAPNMLYTAIAGTNGFDTFVVNGKRYFVRNWAEKAGDRTMNIVVMDEDGNELAKWINPDYVLDGGYSSIIAEPLDDNTVNIYVFNSGNKFGAAAMLNFNPALAGEPIVPEIPVGAFGNPYKIATPQDLVNLNSNLVAGGYTYIEFTDDIDMAGVAYVAPATDAVANVHINGNNHVIKNLSITTGVNPGNFFGALFANMNGSVKNLGFIDVDLTCSGWGGAGAIAGYIGVNEYTTIENCFVTGNLYGESAQLGAFACGAKVGGATISNCYSSATLTSPKNGMQGGLVGAVMYAEGKESVLNINNSYFTGSIDGATVGGLVGANQSYLHPATGTEVININNCALLSATLKGKTTCNAYANNVGGTLTVNAENVLVGDKVTVNDTAVEDAVAEATIVKAVMAWEGFNSAEVSETTQLPILAWQSGVIYDPTQTGVTEIEASEEVPAVYYNLQGVRVANPENGIYIVRRGEKVTKEFVK